MKTFSDFNIEIPGNRRSGKIKLVCPKCKDTRHNKNDKSLSVDIDKGVWHCHHCSWSGTIHVGKRSADAPKKQYTRPAPKPITTLPRRVVDWFNNRGISERTLNDLKISAGMHWMPGGQTLGTIQFNYFLDKELINVKYRTNDKQFMLEQGAELIPYNLNSICGKSECIITEGEMDALSFHEIGLTSVVSVPNGANANLSYLDDFIDGWFEDKEVIYVAVDTDTKGLQLRDELVRRFGSERCRIVTYGDDCKDANECLMKYGKEALERHFRSAKDVKVSGVYSLEDYEDELDSIYHNGLKRGFLVGHPNLDELISFEMKRLAIVTGIPGCLAGDTKVTLADGSHTTMRDIKVGDVVRTLGDKWRMTSAPVTYKWNSGVKEVFALTLANGSVVKATLDHKFLTFNGWKPLSEIGASDYLLVEEKYDAQGCELSDDELTLCAMWIANGNKSNCSYVVSTYSATLKEILRGVCDRQNLSYRDCGEGSIIIGCREPLKSDRKRYVSSLSYLYRKRGEDWDSSVSHAEDVYNQRVAEGCSLINPARMLRNLGLWGCTTNGLFIPEEIFRADKRQLATFLNILFACDGSIYKGKVEYSTKSRELAHNVCELLRRFGIQACVYPHATNYLGRKVFSYRVSFAQGGDVQTFVDEIGMAGKETQISQSLESINPKIGRLIPSCVKTDFKHTKKVYFEELCFHIKPERNSPAHRMSLKNALACAEYDGNEDLAQKLTAGQWTKVKSIEFVGEEMTYDIEVASTHNFITTCVTSNSGKSELLDEMVARFNISYGFKVGFFSPENMPIEYHMVKIIEKLCGKRLQSEDVNGECITRDQYMRAKAYCKENFYHIMPDDGCTIDNILAKAKYLVRRYGIRILVIDPFNRIDNEQSSKESETQYISRVLDKLTYFAQQQDILIFLMAHPTKVKKDNGNGGIPTMYDINGSANFYNKADFGIIVHRERGDQSPLPPGASARDRAQSSTDSFTRVRIEKVKFRHLGTTGEALFKYNLINGRYIPWSQTSGPVDFRNDMDDFILAKMRGTSIQPEIDRLLPWETKQVVLPDKQDNTEPFPAPVTDDIAPF